MDIDLMMSIVWWSSGATSPRHTLLSLLIEGALCWCLAAAATVGQGMYVASSCNGFCFMAIYKLFWYRFVIFVPST